MIHDAMMDQFVPRAYPFTNLWGPDASAREVCETLPEDGDIIRYVFYIYIYIYIYKYIQQLTESDTGKPTKQPPTHSTQPSSQSTNSARHYSRF